MLADITGQPKNDPLPTGTFRGDAWDDLDKRKPAKAKPKMDDDFDVDNLLDDLEEKKGIKSSKNTPMGDTRNSGGLWSAGGGASSRREEHLNEDLDRLDELDDPAVQGERVKFSEGKNTKNLKSED